METYYPELIGGTRSLIRVNTLPEFNASDHLGSIIYVKYEDAFYFGTAIGWYGLGPYGPTGGTGATGGLGNIGVSGGTGGSGGTGYTGATGGADSACCYKFAVNDISSKNIEEDSYQQIDIWKIKHNLNTNYYFINVFKSDGTEYILNDSQLKDKTTQEFTLSDLEGFISKGNVIVTKALCSRSPKPYRKEQHDYYNVWNVNVDPRILDSDLNEIYFYSIFGELLNPLTMVGLNESQIQVTFKDCHRGYSFIWADNNPDFVGGLVQVNNTYEKEYLVESPMHEWIFEHNFNVEEPDTDLDIEVFDRQDQPCPQFNFDFERYETVKEFYKAKGIVPDSSPEGVILNTSSCPLLVQREEYKKYRNPESSDFDKVTMSPVVSPFNMAKPTEGTITLPALKAPFNNFKKSNKSYFNDNLGYIIKSNTPTTLKITFFKFRNESLPIPTPYCGKLNVKYHVNKLIDTSFCHKKVNEHVHVQNLLSSVWYIKHDLNTKNIRINLDVKDDVKYLVCYLTPNKIKIYFYKYDHEFLAYENVDNVIDRTLPSNITLVKRSGRANVFRAVPLIGFGVSDTPTKNYFPEDGRILVHTQYFPVLTDDELSHRLSLKHFPIQSLVVKEREMNNEMHCMVIRHNAGTKENLEVEFYEIVDINKMVRVDPDYIVFESPDVLRLYFTVPAEPPLSNVAIQVQSVIPKRGIVKVYHVLRDDEISPLKKDNYKNIIPETYYKHKYTFTHKQLRKNNIWNIKHDLLNTNIDLYKFYISSCNPTDCLPLLPYTINILHSTCLLDHLLDIIYISNSEIQLVFDGPVLGEVTFSIDLPFESLLPTNLCATENQLSYRHIQYLKSHIWYITHNLDTLNPSVYAICDSQIIQSSMCCHPVPVRIYPKVEILTSNSIKLIFQQVLTFHGAAVITVKDEALYDQLKKLPWLIFGESDTGDFSRDFESFSKQEIIDFRSSITPVSKPANLMFQALDNYGETLAPDQNVVYLSDSELELDFKNLLHLQKRLLNGFCIIKSVDVQYDPTRLPSQAVQIFDQSREPEYLVISTPTTGKAYITDGNLNALRAPLHVLDLSAIMVPPSKDWIIKHDYNTKSLSIRCYDPLGEPMYPESIEYVSDSEIRIHHPYVMVLNDNGTVVTEEDHPLSKWKTSNYDICSRLLIRKISSSYPQRNESFYVHEERAESWKEFVKRTENRDEYFRYEVSDWPDTYWKVRHNLNTKYPKLTFFHLDGSIMKFDGEFGINDPPHRIYYINEQYLEICWLPSDPRFNETMRTPGRVLVQRVERPVDLLLSKCHHTISGTGGTGATGGHVELFEQPPTDYCNSVIDYTIDDHCVISSDLNEIRLLKDSLLTFTEIPADETEYDAQVLVYESTLASNAARRTQLDKKYREDVKALDDKYAADCRSVDSSNASAITAYNNLLIFNAAQRIFLTNKYNSDVAKLEADYIAEKAAIDLQNANNVIIYDNAVISINLQNALILQNHTTSVINRSISIGDCDQTFTPDLNDLTISFTPDHPELDPWIIGDSSQFSNYSLSEIPFPSFRLSEELYDNFNFPVSFYFNQMFDTVLCNVIAHTEIGGEHFNLCICRSSRNGLYQGSLIPNYFIAYNFGLSNFRILHSVTFDEAPTTAVSPNGIPTSNYLASMYNFTVQCCKSGSKVMFASGVNMSEMTLTTGVVVFRSDPKLVRPEHVFVLDLLSDPDLVKFIGPQRVGIGGLGTLVTTYGKPSVRAFGYANRLIVLNTNYTPPPISPPVYLPLPTGPVVVPYPPTPDPIPLPVLPVDPSGPTLRPYPDYPPPVPFPVYPIDPDPPVKPPPIKIHKSEFNIFNCAEGTVWVYAIKKQKWESIGIEEWINIIDDDDFIPPCRQLEFIIPDKVSLGFSGFGGKGKSVTGGTGGRGPCYINFTNLTKCTVAYSPTELISLKASLLESDDVCSGRYAQQVAAAQLVYDGQVISHQNAYDANVLYYQNLYDGQYLNYQTICDQQATSYASAMELYNQRLLTYETEFSEYEQLLYNFNNGIGIPNHGCPSVPSVWSNYSLIDTDIVYALGETYPPGSESRWGFIPDMSGSGGYVYIEDGSSFTCKLATVACAEEMGGNKWPPETNKPYPKNLFDDYRFQIDCNFRGPSDDTYMGVVLAHLDGPYNLFAGVCSDQTNLQKYFIAMNFGLGGTRILASVAGAPDNLNDVFMKRISGCKTGSSVTITFKDMYSSYSTSLSVDLSLDSELTRFIGPHRVGFGGKGGQVLYGTPPQLKSSVGSFELFLVSTYDTQATMPTPPTIPTQPTVPTPPIAPVLFVPEFIPLPPFVPPPIPDTVNNIYDCEEFVVWSLSRSSCSWEPIECDEPNNLIPCCKAGSCPPNVGGVGGTGGTGGTGKRNPVSFEAGRCPFDFDGIDTMATNFGTSVLRFQPDYPNNHNRNIIFDKYFNSIPMLTETFKEDMESDRITPKDQELYPTINPAIDEQWQHARYIYSLDRGGSRIGVKLQKGKFTGDCNPPNQLNAFDIDDALHLRQREEALDYESRPLLKLKRTSDNHFIDILLHSRYEYEYKYFLFSEEITSNELLPDRTYYNLTNFEKYEYTVPAPWHLTPEMINNLFYIRLFKTSLKNREFIVTLKGTVEVNIEALQSNPDGSVAYDIPQAVFVIIAYKVLFGEIHTLSIVRRKTFPNGKQRRPKDATFYLVYNYGFPNEQFLYENFVIGTNLGVDYYATGPWASGRQNPDDPNSYVTNGQTVTLGVARIGNKIRINSSLFNKPVLNYPNPFLDPDIIIDLEKSNLLNMFIDETDQYIGFGSATMYKLESTIELYDVATSNHNIPDICNQRSGGLWKWDTQSWKWNYTPDACCRKADYRFVAAHAAIRYYDISWYKQWYLDNPNDIYDQSSLVGFTGHSGNTDVSGEQWPEEVLQVLDDDYFTKVEKIYQSPGTWVWCSRFLNPGDTYDTRYDVQKYQNGWIFASYNLYPVKQVLDSRPPSYGIGPHKFVYNSVDHYGNIIHTYLGTRVYSAHGCRKPAEMGNPNSEPSFCATYSIKTVKEGVVATIGSVFAIAILDLGENLLQVLSPLNNKWVPCHAAYVEHTYNEDFRKFMTEVGESESGFTYWYLKGGSMALWTYEPIWVQILDDDGNHDYWELRGGATHWVDFRRYMAPDTLLTSVANTEAPGCKTEGYDHEVWWVWTGDLGRAPTHHEGVRLVAIQPNEYNPVVIDTPFARGPGDGPGGNPHWAKDTLNRYVWVNRFKSVVTRKTNYPTDEDHNFILTDWEYEYSYGEDQISDQVYDTPEYYEYVYWPLLTPPLGLVAGGNDTDDPNILTTGPRPFGTTQLECIDSSSHLHAIDELGRTIYIWNIKLLWLKNEVGDEEDHRIIIFDDQRSNRSYPPNMNYDLSGHGLIYKVVDGERIWKDYGPVMTNKSGFVWDQWNKVDHRNINVCQKLAVNTYVEDDGYSLYFEFTNALTGDPVNLYWQCINYPEKLEIVVSYIYLYEERWLNVLRDPMHRDILPGAVSVEKSWDNIDSPY